MDVKPGYKQTEAGIIPEDWIAAKLSAICSMKSGEAITSANIDVFSSFPCYGGNGLRGYTSRYTHTGDHALIGRQGALCGNVLGVSGKFFASEHAIVVTASEKTSIRWLTYILGEMRLNQYSESSAQPGLSVAKIVSLPIAVPPTKAEQEAIAEALSDTDAYIKSLERLIAKKRQVKQGAMQELLPGRRRLPGFNGEWEEKRLGSLSVMGSGGTPSTSNPDFYDGNIPWVSITDMTSGGKFILETERSLSAVGLKHSAAQMFPAGTVLYAIYASLGECNIAGVSLCTSQAILGIQTKSTLHNEFLYYLLNFIKPQVRAIGQQGTQANLNKGMVQGFQLKLPSVPEQTAIAKTLSEMDEEITVLERKLAKARQIKQGMMQELLTGRIRLI